MPKQKATPRRKPRTKQRTAVKPHGLSRRKIIAIVGIALLLSLTGGMLAKWRAAGLTAKTNALHSPVPAPTPTQFSLSKEYIYAGNKLVAIEEPAGVNVAPVVQLTAPANGATMTSPANITLTATASDSDGIGKVEFYLGTTKLGEDLTAPYTLSWNNVVAGSYSLTAKATDNLGAVTTSSAVTITVNPAGVSTLENVSWANAVRVEPFGNSLRRSESTNAWDGGASSTKAIASGDGYVQFTVSDVGYRMCGLSNGDTDQNYSDIDFAIYPSANGTINIYEQGVWRGSFGTYSLTDTFKVSVTGGVIKYWQNNVQINVSNTPAPTYPLHVDASLYTPNSTINNVKLSGWLTP